MAIAQQVPRVSVAILSFNQREYLRECIESVLQQGYENLQIVVADDASTDGSAELARDYEQAAPHLFRVLVAPQNQGITRNSNAALGACDGEYIAWMGGDDLMLPQKLARQVAYLEAHPRHVICYHDLEVFESRSGRLIRYFNSGPGSLSPHQGGASVLVEHGTFLGACSVMTRRGACPSGGFDPRIPIASDWLFWIQTALNGDIGYIDQVLGRYRRHEQNITAIATDTADEHLTLAILEAEQPQLHASIRRGRARLFYIRTFRHLLARQYRPAQQYLWAGLRQGLPSRRLAKLGLQMLWHKTASRRMD